MKLKARRIPLGEIPVRVAIGVEKRDVYEGYPLHQFRTPSALREPKLPRLSEMLVHPLLVRSSDCSTGSLRLQSVSYNPVIQ